MAQIANVHAIPVDGEDFISVTVSCDLLFDSTEDGKPYRVAIELIADDSTDPPKWPQLPSWLYTPPALYTFRFGGWPFPRTTPYRTITADANGVHIEETRSIPRAALNEDPETIQLPFGGRYPVADEFRAHVTIMQVSEALSEIQKVLV